MEKRAKYPILFVHGMFGWGRDEGINDRAPYWGANAGRLVDYLAEAGYEAYDLSVGPVSSAWDRACEMYACLTGKTVDYGKAHAEKYGHRRYGRTYETPLLEHFSAEHKVHLVGHSFGGMTVRMFAHLMAFGAPEERAATPDEELSDLFRGGHADWIQSVYALCTPHNGAMLYRFLKKLHLLRLFEGLVMAYIGLVGKTRLLYKWVDFHLEHFGIHDSPGKRDREPLRQAKRRFLHTTDNIFYGISPASCMEVDELTQPMIDSVYYYSGYFNAIDAARAEKPRVKHARFWVLKLMARLNLLVFRREFRTGVFSLEDYENDGLLEVSCAHHPFNQPYKDFDPAHNEPGVWQVLPEYRGDHGVAIGMKVPAEQTHAFYLSLVQMLASTE